MRLTPTAKRIAALQLLIGVRIGLFFDIDGTLFVKQLLVELMLACARRFPSKREIVAPLRAALRKYRLERTYNFDPVIDAAVSAVVPFFVGLPKAEVMEIARKIVATHGKETYLFPRMVLRHYAQKQRLSERGLVVAITGAPQEIAEIFCAQFGFDLVYGVTYETVGGIYTGVRNERTVHDKGGVLLEVAKTFDLNVHESVTFGDTMGDRPMLHLVKYAFAVNPNLSLLRALASGNPDCTGHVVWVNDRQKNGVSYFMWRQPSAQLGPRWLQFPQSVVVPEFLRVSNLPGPPCSL